MCTLCVIAGTSTDKASATGETSMPNTINQLGYSAYGKVLRPARTLADLDHAETIREKHVAEAIQYRTLDPGLV